MRTKWESETELANGVVAYLRGAGWTVYPELHDIDIIATRPDPNAPNGLLITGIECKQHFNLTVLHQAWDKQRYVDQMSVAVSHGYQDHENFGCRIAQKFGLGVLYVSKNQNYMDQTFSYPVKLQEEAVVEYRRLFYVDKLLHPQAENYSEPGRKGGKQWSRFKMTVFYLVEYAKEHPGCTIKDALLNVKHHYSSPYSARACISKRIKDGTIKELKVENNLLYVTCLNSNLDVPVLSS